jgi:hypothetical protein
MSEVFLACSKGIEKPIKLDSIKKSAYLKNKFFNQHENPIILPESDERILDLIITYLNFYTDHQESPLPEVLITNDLKSELKSEWDYNFLKDITYEETFHLINAASLLELTHLHDLACIKIAAFMKDKTPDEVNKEFTIECQLTNEEAKTLGLD